jgi:hypothetical protein
MPPAAPLPLFTPHEHRADPSPVSADPARTASEPLRIRGALTPRDQRRNLARPRTGRREVLARHPYNSRMTSLLPILLTVHIVLAISLVLPSIVLPFALRSSSSAGPSSSADASAPAPTPGPAIRGLLWLQAHGTMVIGLGLAATGTGLLAVLGTELLAKPWLAVALLVYAGNLALAFFIQRPGIRRLLGGERSEAAWRAVARRQRYVSYAMAGLTGTIGYLMSTKPELW